MEETYLDEVLELTPIIRRRKAVNWRIALAIASNPHVSDEDDRRALPDMLEAEMEGEQITPSKEDTSYDKSGMELLKFKMRENPRIVVK